MVALRHASVAMARRPVFVNTSERRSDACASGRALARETPGRHGKGGRREAMGGVAAGQARPVRPPSSGRRVMAAVPFSYCPRCGTRLRPTDIEGRLTPACPACSFVAYPDPKVAAAVIAERDGRVLLVQRARPPIGQWCLPAGYVNADEAPPATAARELEEETRLRVRIAGLVDVLSDASSGVLLIVYRGNLLGGALHIDPEENLAAGFFSEDELPDDSALAFETGRAAIRAWLRGR